MRGRFISSVLLVLAGSAMGAILMAGFGSDEHELVAKTGDLRVPDLPSPSTPSPNNRSSDVDRLLAWTGRAAQEHDMLFEQLQDLETRLDQLVARVEAVDSAPAVDSDRRPTLPPTAAGRLETEERPPPMQAYLDVGLDPLQVEDIRRRLADLEMERLYLRDQAIREGWIGTDRYAEELQELESGNGQLRGELGDDAFDRFLFASGRSNRVRIESVIPGSPADQAGLVAGDVVVSYAGQRILSFGDLTDATTAGNSGAQVRVSVIRGEALMAVLLPRGPLGVRLAPLRLTP